MTSPLHQFIHIDPRKVGYGAYSNHVESYNKAVQIQIGEDLESILRDVGQRCVLATTGSDGRLEKGPVSLMELVIFTDNKQALSPVQHALDEYMRWIDGRKYFDDAVEVKDPKHDTIAHFLPYAGKKRENPVISPNRIFDAYMLYGDESLFEEVQNKLVAEMQSEELGRNIWRRIKDCCQHHRRVAETGRQRFKKEDLVHVDIAKGLAHYDPKQYLWSFKQGSLRAVQYALVRDQMTMLKEYPESGKFIFRLPKNTTGKIYRCEVQGNLAISHEEANALIDHYKFFLWAYHCSQQAYYYEKRKTIPFAKDEIAQRSSEVAEICAKRIMTYTPSKKEAAKKSV